MRLPSMTLKRLLLAGNNFTAIAGLIFSDYFNKILINDKRGNIDSIKLIINEKKISSFVDYLPCKQIFFL